MRKRTTILSLEQDGEHYVEICGQDFFKENLNRVYEILDDAILLSLMEKSLIISLSRKKFCEEITKGTSNDQAIQNTLNSIMENVKNIQEKSVKMTKRNNMILAIVTLVCVAMIFTAMIIGFSHLIT